MHDDELMALPPGFRFHPTDEELIMHYLRNQAMATSRPCPVSNIIPQLDLYKFDPWDLPEQADQYFGEKEWYFFTPRDRKYPNGVRPNRAAVSGYWKATGTDKPIYSSSKYVGVKKALVFYTGRPPKGLKTDWIMHEYRLITTTTTHHHHHHHHHHAAKPKPTSKLSMRLDDWVLCRIYKKKKSCNIMTTTKEINDHPHELQNNIMNLKAADQEDKSSSSVQPPAPPPQYNNNNNVMDMVEPPPPPPPDLKQYLPWNISHLWEFDCLAGSSTSLLINGGTQLGGESPNYTSLSPDQGRAISHSSAAVDQSAVFGFQY